MSGVGGRCCGCIAVALLACGRTPFEPAHNIAFVTSAAYNPLTFGADLSGADAICAAAATAGGLHDTFVAFLDTTTATGADRLGSSRGWLRLDGKPFVDRVDDLAAGKVYYPLLIDELGENIGPQVPIAVGARDRNGTAFTCNGWSDGTLTYTAVGSETTTYAVSLQGVTACTSFTHVACFTTGFDAPLVVTPTPVIGRRMFVTVQTFTAGGGLASADALCAQEASLAGISGTFLAMLSTSTASAVSRLDLHGPPWVRLDGIALASSPLALVGGELDTSPSVTSLGAIVDEFVLTGGSIAAAGTGTCSDWTDPVGSVNPGIGGVTYAAGEFAFANAVVQRDTCSAFAPIYCFEP